MSIQVFSYGGGVQSTAALVLAAQGKINYKTFLFCNVGDDSEHPETLKYVHEIAMPYAREKGIELIEIANTRSGQKVNPTPTPTLQPTATPTATVVPSPTATSAPSPSPTATPTPTPTPNLSPSPTVSPNPSPTP